MSVAENPMACRRTQAPTRIEWELQRFRCTRSLALLQFKSKQNTINVPHFEASLRCRRGRTREGRSETMAESTLIFFLAGSSSMLHRTCKL
jgi:hypothetical protein